MTIDISTLCEYVEGGQVRKMVNNVTGLDHFEGETVEVQADGIPEESETYVVTSATLVPALPVKAAVIHVGLPYNGTLRFLRTAGGSKIGTGYAKMRRVFLGVLRLKKTLGLKIGLDEDNLLPIFDTDPALPLFSGDQKKLPDTGWRKNAELIIKQDKPLPAEVLAVVVRSEIEEAI